MEMPLSVKPIYLDKIKEGRITSPITVVIAKVSWLRKILSGQRAIALIDTAQQVLTRNGSQGVAYTRSQSITELLHGMGSI